MRPGLRDPPVYVPTPLRRRRRGESILRATRSVPESWWNLPYPPVYVPRASADSIMLEALFGGFRPQRPLPQPFGTPSRQTQKPSGTERFWDPARSAARTICPDAFQTPLSGFSEKVSTPSRSVTPGDWAEAGRALREWLLAWWAIRVPDQAIRFRHVTARAGPGSQFPGTGTG